MLGVGDVALVATAGSRFAMQTWLRDIVALPAGRSTGALGAVFDCDPMTANAMPRATVILSCDKASSAAAPFTPPVR
jgi:hypothetical protein